ncbi:YdcF family protein [Anaerocolumna xylanovorans]|uniref:Protein SanA, affects membrane permeability for vancomycin n=1 Tax=Anaerocolumna xylanovorans DSM 12503 TaxID=1121345 RepID=A0A1M7Y9M8_9FIRM|nr:YdcF family protein [Anaerocolumna xylanovorans]SHO49345.1 protein SanA, affects membrane permeability for vancomycin [Anaerocolumna xylanovorans DSM 12503]
MLLLFSILFLIAGIFCVSYTLIITAYSGAGTAFLWFWIMAGTGSLIASVLFMVLHRKNISFHRIWYWLFLFLILCAAGVFLLVEGNIYIAGRGKVSNNAEYMIVLGAQVRGKTVSRALKNRLDTACKYLKKNTGTVVIVSGGQGRGEEISEAFAMKNYLESKGINGDRILQEDTSVNTYENLKNSKKIIDSRGDFRDSSGKVVIVTNRFHVFRATCLARTQGIKGVQGLGAPNDDILTLHYYVREFFGVIKDVLHGNMKWNWLS